MIQTQSLSPRVFIAACLCCALLSIAACGGLYWSTEPCTDDWYGTRITPPASATVLQEGCRSAFNPDFTLVFTMPPTALAEFQAATPVTDWSTDPTGLISWEAEAARATSLLAGRYIDGAIAVDALIDMSDPARYTVYYKSTFID